MTCKPRYPTYVVVRWLILVLIGGGLQGFHIPIVQDSFVVDGIGALGNKQSERNLTYVEISLAGHM
jgi:carboxypeptidase D